jgi:PsbP-like protein
MRPILFVLLVIVQLSVAAQTTTTKPVANAATATWLSYTDATTGITVKYPSTWRLKTTNPKTPIVLHAPSEGDTDDFSENINYIVRDLPPNQKVTLADISTSVRNGLTNVVDDFNLEYEKNLQWLGVKAVEFSYTGTSKGENAGFQIKLLQRIALVKGKMVLATYSAQDGKEDPSRADAIKIIGLTTLKK